MNAVEIERAVSALAAAPFDPEEFPYAFLEAFGNKATTIRRLRAGASNKSDIGGVLQNGNIHIAVATPRPAWTPDFRGRWRERRDQSPFFIDAVACMALPPPVHGRAE